MKTLKDHQSVHKFFKIKDIHVTKNRTQKFPFNQNKEKYNNKMRIKN